MKLVGVAADVVDARMQRPLCSTGAASPLNLFGCVGEGSTADAMAREALLLWVGISSAPQHCSNGRKTEVGASGVGGGEKAGDSLCPPRTLEDLDAPVLKGIFCASDAIRLRLAKSLLSVCGVDIPEVEAEDSGAVPGDIAGIEDADVVVQEGGAENIEEVSGDGGGVAVQTDADVLVEEGAVELENKKSTAGKLTPKEAQVVEYDTFGAHTASAADTEDMIFEDELPGHIVRLLLDNIPRPEGAAGGGLPGGALENEAFSRASGAVVPGTVVGRRSDCTELFTVLCTLVGESMKVGVGRDRRPSKKPALDVQELLSDLVARLVAHPCTERRGSKEDEKDTLLVGLLNLGVTVVEACPESAGPLGKDLVETLLEDFLFAPPRPARYMFGGGGSCFLEI